MLLFAREETFRSSSLANATVSDTSISVPMDNTHTTELVQAFMNWTRYQYSGGSWGVYNAEDDLKRLKLELAEEPYFQPEDNSSVSLDIARGKIISTQSYYSAMLTGSNAIVQADGALTWTASGGYDEVDEVSYSAEWPKTTFTGATYTAFEVKTMLSGAIKALWNNTNGFLGKRSAITS